MTSYTLAGKVALVTGAGRNIGRAIALELAQNGAIVVVNTRTNTREAAATVAAIESAGGKAIGLTADVGDEQQVQRMVAQATEQVGIIDILINNAGLRRSCAFTEMTTATWREIMATNLDGPFFCCRAVVPGMIAAGGGTIINISGLNAFIGRDQWAHVCSSKMGALGLTRSLAVELAPHQITVNHIVPGAIDTTHGTSSDMLTTARRLAGIPLQRLGYADEIAALCAFLSSTAARFVTGQTLHVNGGALRC